MIKSIKQLRTDITSKLKDKASYLAVPAGKIVESSDKISSDSAPFINVSVRRVSMSEFTNSNEAKALVLIIFQVPTSSNYLKTNDDLFDMYEKLEYLIHYYQIPMVADGGIKDLDFQITYSDTSIAYGTLMFTTNYVSNPPSL